MPSTGRGSNRNRVMADRLWDEAGREWTMKRTAWLTDKQVQQLIKRDQPVVIHGFGRRMQWLDAREAQVWWSHARRHLEVPDNTVHRPTRRASRGAPTFGVEKMTACSASRRSADLTAAYTARGGLREGERTSAASPRSGVRRPVVCWDGSRGWWAQAARAHQPIRCLDAVLER